MPSPANIVEHVPSRLCGLFLLRCPLPSRSCLCLVQAERVIQRRTANPIVQINLKRTPDGLKLKDIKVAPFFFKQFTVVKGAAQK